MINPSIQERLKFVALLLIVLLVTALLYTTLHEGGHALAGLAFGGRVTDFNVNFLTWTPMWASTATSPRPNRLCSMQPGLYFQYLYGFY